MKYTLLLCMFCFAFAQGKTQIQEPCSSFRSGNFLYTDENNITWELSRNGKRQTETNKKTGKTVKFRILWLNECEYRLTQVWTNIRERRKWNRAHYTYRIIATTARSYTYSCICKDSPTVGGTVVRLDY